jgi:hypothetical protein
MLKINLGVMFKAIEEERTKILKEHKNKQVKMVKEYFKLPDFISF